MASDKFNEETPKGVSENINLRNFLRNFNHNLSLKTVLQIKNGSVVNEF